MEKIIIDSSVIIGHLTRNESCSKLLRLLLASQREIIVSAASLFEIYSRKEFVGGSAEETQKLTDLLSQFNCIPITNDIAKYAGIYRNWYSSQEGLDLQKYPLTNELLFVASTAKLLGATITTLPEKVGHYNSCCTDESPLSGILVFGVPSN